MSSDLERPLPAAHLADAVRFRGWTLDLAQQRLLRDGEEQVLDPKSQSVLLHLIECAPHVVSLQEILSRTWPRMVVTDNVVYRTISELRRVLGDTAAQPKYIETVARRGYRLRSPIDVQPKRAVQHPGRMVASSAATVGCAIRMDPFAERGRAAGGRVRAVECQEELQALLVGYPELRNLSMQGHSSPAEYLITGVVSHTGGASALRLVLTRTSNDQVVWSRRFDLSGPECTEAIARYLRLQLVHDQECERVEAACTDPQAARLYRLARAEQYRISQEGNFDAQLQLSYVQRAARLEPDIPQIQKLLSDSCLWASVFNQMPRQEASARAHAAIARALTIDPEYADALVGLAAVQTTLDLDFCSSEASYRRAIAVDPRVLFAHNGLGEISAYLGRPWEAVEHYRRAVRLFDSDARIFTEYARCLNAVGDYEGAVEAARAGRGLLQTGPYRMLLAAEEVYAQNCLGNRDAAMGVARSAFEAAGAVYRPTYAALLAEAGLLPEARAMLRLLESRRTPVTGCCMVRACLNLNRTDDAFRWLARAMEVPETFLFSEIRHHPRYAELREDPRWQRFADLPA